MVPTQALIKVKNDANLPLKRSILNEERKKKREKALKTLKNKTGPSSNIWRKIYYFFTRIREYIFYTRALKGEIEMLCLVFGHDIFSAFTVFAFAGVDLNR